MFFPARVLQSFHSTVKRQPVALMIENMRVNNAGRGTRGSDCCQHQPPLLATGEPTTFSPDSDLRTVTLTGSSQNNVTVTLADYHQDLIKARQVVGMSPKTFFIATSAAAFQQLLRGYVKHKP
jgi:hypothetical protein